ncbi:MAG: RHS repeat-associated core domain-containing protein [SAR202 cluster bacterium]|nr:RHS repeat-associated core domain-containing protein [SAR202 cluster bacterium]
MSATSTSIDSQVFYTGDRSYKLSSLTGDGEVNRCMYPSHGQSLYRGSIGTFEAFTVKAMVKFEDVVGSESFPAGFSTGVSITVSAYDETIQNWIDISSPGHVGDSDDWIEITTPPIKTHSQFDHGFFIVGLYLYGTGTAWFDQVRFETTVMEAKWEGSLMTQHVDGHNVTTTYRYGSPADTFDPDNPSGNPNNLMSVTDHTGGTVTFKYDNQNRLIERQSAGHQGTSKKMSFAYDAIQKDLMETVDELNNTATYTYDSYGQALTFKDPNANAADGSNPTGMTYEYVYNGYGLVTDAYSPVNASSSELLMQKFYDDNRGLVTSTIDALGQKTCFDYDYLGRLKRTTYLCATASAYKVTNTYDENGNLTHMADFRNGQVATTTYEYDAGGQVTKVTEPYGLYTQYTYDALGNVVTLRNPDGQTIRYYNSPHGVTFYIYDPYANGITTQLYDSGGRLRQVEYPGCGYYTCQDANEVVYAFTDASGVEQGVMTKVENRRSGSVLKGYAYSWDDNWNVSQIVETPTVATTTFSYSDIGALIGATRTGSSPYSQTFTYDPNGNRKTMVKGGVTYTYTYNAANQMLSEVGTTTKTFLYDNNGNMRKEGTNNYFSYNGASRMVTSTIAGSTWDHAYDGFNQRITISDTTTTSQYFSLFGLALERRAGANYAKYVFAPDGRPVSITGPDGTFNYFFDGSGNVIGMIKNDGTADYYAYQPFGEELGTQGTRYNPLRYSAAYQEKVNGKTLYNMGMRWYSPDYGRFSQPDPISHVNSYGYAGNNPILFNDPDGQVFVIAIPAAYGVILVGTVALATLNEYNRVGCFDGAIEALGNISFAKANKAVNEVPVLPAGQKWDSGWVYSNMFKEFNKKCRQNDKKGKEKRYYALDKSHSGEWQIEVYDKNFKAIGSISALGKFFADGAWDDRCKQKGFG